MHDMDLPLRKYGKMLLQQSWRGQLMALAIIWWLTLLTTTRVIFSTTMKNHHNDQERSEDGIWGVPPRPLLAQARVSFVDGVVQTSPLSPALHDDYNDNAYVENTKNPHHLLSNAIRKLARNVAPGKSFTILAVPHFVGGRDLIREDLSQRRNMTEIRPRDAAYANLVVVSCVDRKMKKSAFFDSVPNSVLSASVDERALVVKRGFYWAVKRAAHGVTECYTSVIPETFMTEHQEECLDLLNRLSVGASSSSQPTIWYLKNHMESFGRGITTLDTAGLVRRLNGCQQGANFSTVNFLVQKGLPNVVRLDGKVTQARVYVVIPRFVPLTVFFQEGYVNVALSPNSTVTNGLNNKTPRLLPRDFFHSIGLSPKEQAELRRRVKLVVLRAILALRVTLSEIASSRSYAIWGVDIVYYHEPYSGVVTASVVELNCNAEFFARESVAGRVRERVSRNLIRNTHDVVLAAHYARPQFDRLLETVIGHGHSHMRDAVNSLELDMQSSVLELRRPLELLFSDSPRFSLLDSDEFCASNDVGGGGEDGSYTGDGVL